MEKKKIIKFISLIIFTLIIFQLIPNLADCVGSFKSDTQASKAHLPSGKFHTETLHTGRSSHIKTIPKIQSNTKSIYIPYITIEGISAILPSFNEKSLDYRKVIRQSILHYFNASKYKLTVSLCKFKVYGLH